MELNEAQLAAATAATTGVTMVQAGAGTGKSSMLRYRVKYLIENHPGRILMLAFNRSTVTEQKEKLQNVVVDSDLRRLVTIMTSYGNAFTLIRQNWNLLGLPQFPGEPIPEWKAVKQAKEVLTGSVFSKYKLDEPLIKAILAAEAYRRTTCSNNYVTYVMNSLILTKASIPDRMLREINDLLFVHRRKEGHIMFMDMLTMALELPSSAYIKQNYTHLLVDEAQDLSMIQHQFVDRYYETNSVKSLTFVGDASQSIYRFSGASPELFISIPERYENVSNYKLQTNYRSNQPILDLANRVLGELLESPIQLTPAKEVPGHAVHVLDGTGSLAFWLNSLRTHVVDKDIAILFRARSHVLTLEALLIENGIPYTCSSGSYFDHPVVEDVTCYFKQYYSELGDLDAWKRIVKHMKFLPDSLAVQSFNLNPKTPWITNPDFEKPYHARIWSELKKHCYAVFGMLADEKPYKNLTHVYLQLFNSILEERWRDATASDPELEAEYTQMREALVKWFKTLDSGQQVFDMLDQYENNRSTDGVSLMSIHKSKGLEFPYTALWWVGNGTLPLDQNDLEELRLLYVGVTRAQKELALCTKEGLPGSPLVDLLPPNKLFDLIGEISR